MILEAIEYLRTPCKPEFRKLGYLHELIALQAREKRLHKQWSPHHEQCRDLIRQAALMCQSHRKVIVLGSGLLADTPLGFLSAHFEDVVLVDVIHLKHVRRQARDYPNIQLVEADISGLAQPLLAMKRRVAALPESRADIPQLDENTDLVISANLLSQLCIAPLNYAVPRFGFTNEQYIEWCRGIIQAHLDALLGSGARVCLITDLVHVEIDRRGEEVKREDMLFGLTLPDAAWLWEWQLAPYGEISRKFKVSAVVSGFINFPYPGQ